MNPILIERLEQVIANEYNMDLLRQLKTQAGSFKLPTKSRPDIADVDLNDRLRARKISVCDIIEELLNQAWAERKELFIAVHPHVPHTFTFKQWSFTKNHNRNGFYIKELT